MGYGIIWLVNLGYTMLYLVIIKCLVGGLEHGFYFPIQLIPTDELIFFRGVG